jgi:hypothetical protein
MEMSTHIHTMEFAMQKGLKKRAREAVESVRHMREPYSTARAVWPPLAQKEGGSEPEKRPAGQYGHRLRRIAQETDERELKPE